MSLTSVKMSEEVWMTCLTHALSTETEEIMGLLLGDIKPSKNGGEEALIWGASPQPRCDRQKDRVETNPEQLAAASAQAEKMTTATGRTTRVIGWYHSHPHITVLPSHVDVRTQAMYQQLDSGFIGLIFSCFSEDVHKVGRIQIIAFQSLDGNQTQILRAVSLSPVNQGAIVNLGLSLSTSENAFGLSGTAIYESLEQDTADSKATVVHSQVSGKSSDVGGVFANADASNLGKENIHGNYQIGSVDNAIVEIDNAIVEIDSMDMSGGMQEALLRSELEVSGADFIRKEIPLHVLPALSLLKLVSPLASYVDLQRVLFEEEKAAYNQAILQSMRYGKVHPLTFIHHKSTYEASLCKLMEYCLSPAINALQDRLRELELREENLSNHQGSSSQQANTSASVVPNLETNKNEKKIIIYQRRRHRSTEAKHETGADSVEPQICVTNAGDDSCTITQTRVEEQCSLNSPDCSEQDQASELTLDSPQQLIQSVHSAPNTTSCRESQ